MIESILHAFELIGYVIIFGPMLYFIYKVIKGLLE